MAASLEVAVVTTAVLTGALFWVARPALGWLGATDEVANAALPYLELILASSLGMAVALLLESALRANRDMRTPMWIAGIVTITKLGGNALLIFGYAGFPRLELVGVRRHVLLGPLREGGLAP